MRVIVRLRVRKLKELFPGFVVKEHLLLLNCLLDDLAIDNTLADRSILQYRSFEFAQDRLREDVPS